ncbi:speriolin-like protein isoform X2 [Mixophyes fleayi]|uniref:speriolin-like protein isoform X2 n=1 Tax=Mixophyes fleayi TaxID=3061075 RepID=UPI003F4D7E06
MNQQQSYRPEPRSELEILRIDRARLLSESAELRKMVGLLQENLELRRTLRKHELKMHSISMLGSYCSKNRDEDRNESYPTPSQDEDKNKSQPTSIQDPKLLRYYQRVVGEIAFQLDRRILCSIFQELDQLYGFFMSNIEEMIHQMTTCPLSNKVDEAQRSVLYHRYHEAFKKLKKLGYDKDVHPTFTEYLVNTYGILKDRPPIGTSNVAPYLYHPEDLRKMIAVVMPTDNLKHVYLLLDCLKHLAEDEGRPLFLW